MARVTSRSFFLTRSWTAPLALASAMLLSAIVGTPLRAERYAVLAGVSAYRNGINQLEGPAEDVRAMKEALVRNGYSAENVVVLVNDQASRENILKTLEAKVKQLTAGDHLFFYFSGHGTSAFDKNNQEISPAIGPDSGGLVPVDLSLKSAQSLVDGLIIGRRDLRPILAKVPPRAQAFVVLDACYSENSAKSAGLWSAAAPRTIHPIDLVEGGPPKPGGAPAAEPESGAYPYSNVVSLAAAAKSQTALDIGSALLRQGAQTVDGKPHGALTNSVLLGLTSRGDTNGDGSISYDELYRFVRHEMEKYPHQPQLLVPSGFSLAQPVLGIRAAAAPPPAPAPSAGDTASRIRVKLENPTRELEALVRAVPDVELTSRKYDLLVRAEGAQWQIYDAGSAPLQAVPLAQTQLVASRIRSYGQLSRLRNWSNPGQKFNVQVDVEPVSASGYDRLRSTFRIGEQVKFRIGAEQRAYLLLLDINKDGKVDVLFPGPGDAERGPQSPDHPVEFVIPASKPAGSDELKLIGFTQPPADWANWACTAATCPEFEASDPRLGKLLTMLQTAGAAEASLRVITRE